MKEILPVLKNKFFISTVIVVLYIVILHDTDVYALISKNQKVSELKEQIEQKQGDIDDLRIALNDLDDPRSLEKYAREYHYFKKADEDLFIFSFE
jgi:cell division protein DivIC